MYDIITTPCGARVAQSGSYAVIPFPTPCTAFQKEPNFNMIEHNCKECVVPKATFLEQVLGWSEVDEYFGVENETIR